MKVCFFIANLGDGGAQRQCIALLNLLQFEPEMELHLILLGHGEHDGRLDASLLHVHRTSVRNFASPFAFAFVVRTLRRIRPDLLISWLHPADIWAYVATRVVRNLPWVLTERGSTYPDELKYNMRKHFGCRGAATIIANSQPGKLLWDALQPRGEVRVIPNILLDGSLVARDTARPSSDAVSCLFVGRLEPQKNVSAAIEAFARFVATQQHAVLMVVGQGAEAQQLRMLAQQCGIAERIQMLGFREDVPALMSRSRVLVSFSRHEGMPNVVMEAVAAGLPAVVSNIPEHRALLGDKYPYYVELGASPEVAAAVMGRAWRESPAGCDNIYNYARSVLASSAPVAVASAYVSAFAETITRSRAKANIQASARCGHWPR